MSITATNTYSNREEEVRSTLSKEQAILRIKSFGGKFNPNFADFDVYDQLLVCESVSETDKYIKEKENGSNYENVIGTYKRGVDSSLNENKLEVIGGLSVSTYKTPIFILANLLESLFKDYNSRPGHWFYIARSYSPRTINRVIAHMIKEYGINWRGIENPAAYFTFLIKYRKKRKRR